MWNCDGFPCLVHAKSDAEVLGVRPALEYPNVTLLTHAEARTLETNPAGTAVTEVVVEREGHRAVPADIVVVACGAANSAALLLASANDRTRTGLANGSDEVGRNYMFHDSQAVLALSREENPTVFQKTLGLNDFYFGGDELRLSRSGNIQMIGKSQAPMYRGEKPLETRLAPPWALRDGRAARGRLLALHRGPAAVPRTGSRWTARAGSQLAYTPTNDRRQAEALRRSSGRCSASCGMQPDHLFDRFAYMKSDIPVAGCAHQAGTCRFGTDPATSVLNVDCRAHELDNLYVVDTSFFPSIGAVNPGLTAMANALRVGDHLLGRLA